MEHLLDDIEKRSWNYRDKEESRRIARGLESEIDFHFKFILTWDRPLKTTKEYVCRVCSFLDKAAYCLNKQHIFAVLHWDFQPNKTGKPLHFHVEVSLEKGTTEIALENVENAFRDCFCNIEGQQLVYFGAYDATLGAIVYGLWKHRGFSFYTGCPKRKRICKQHKRLSGRCFFDNNEKRKRIFKRTSGFVPSAFDRKTEIIPA